MKVNWKYNNIPFVGKWLLVERMLRDLMKRKKAMDNVFKAQKKAGKLSRPVEISAYVHLAEVIEFVEGVVRETRDRVRRYELPDDELWFEIYGIHPRVLTPEEQAKADRAHLLLNATFDAELSAKGREN